MKRITKRTSNALSGLVSLDTASPQAAVKAPQLSIFSPVIFSVLIVFYSFCSGCVFSDSRGCHSNSESVRYAKSIPQSELSKLYLFMERSEKECGVLDSVSPMQGDDIPIELQGLQFRRVDLGRGNIVVEGCFDNYVTMRFYGIGKYKDFPGRKIVLNYGEDYEQQYYSDVLWEGSH